MSYLFEVLFLLNICQYLWSCVNMFRQFCFWICPQIAKFIGPTWGPPGSCWPQMGPMLAPWTLLSGSWMGSISNRLFQLSSFVLEIPCAWNGWIGSLSTRISFYSTQPKDMGSNKGWQSNAVCISNAQMRIETRSWGVARFPRLY